VTDPVALLLMNPSQRSISATKSRILDDLRAWNQAHGIPILLRNPQPVMRCLRWASGVLVLDRAVSSRRALPMKCSTRAAGNRCPIGWL